MSKGLTSFTQIDGHDRLWSAQKGTLRCTALKLKDGTLCLYSPVLGLNEAAQDSLATLGQVSVLLAPNHYHHKGLAEYAQAYPNARLLCSAKAQPRLEKQTGLSFGTLTTLTPKLPANWSVVEPDGLKTGEVWLQRANHDPCTWVVTDAFKGPAGPAGSIGEHIELLGTFPSFGIAAKADYAAWLTQHLEHCAPALVVPCHGALVASQTLRTDMTALLA